jgi:hypothetical protein
LCQVQICFLGGTLLRSPPGPLPFHSLTPSSPSQSIHKRFLFWLSHKDMESIHHTPSPWSPSFTLLPPRRSPPSSTPPHPHTYCPLCIAASFLIPLYVDVSRCFPPSVLFNLVPSNPSVALPFPFLLSTPHFQQLLSLACPGVCFQILVNLHQPLFLLLLPRVPCSNCTFTNVFQVGEGPPSCVFSFMC